LIRYDFGRPIEEVISRCKEETGLDPPRLPRARREFIITRG